MGIGIEQIKRIKILNLIADVSFFLFILTEFAFKYSLISQISIALFIFSITLLCLSKQSVRMNYYFLFIFLFIFLNWININRESVVVESAAQDLLSTLISNFIIAIFLYNYVFHRKNNELVIKLFIVSIMMVDIYILMLSGDSLLQGRLGNDISVNANYIAITNSYALLMTYFLFFVKKNNAYILLLIPLFTIILLSGSRKGLFLAVFGMFIITIIITNKSVLKKTLYSLFLFILTYILITRVPLLHSIIGERVVSAFNFFRESSVYDASLIERNNLLVRGINAFKDNPLFGSGLDSFRYLAGGRNNYYAHNNYIELLVNAGIIGLILYYINFIIAISRVFIKKIKVHSFAFLMMIILILTLFIDFALVSYFGRMYLIPLLLTIAFTENTKKVELNDYQN